MNILYKNTNITKNSCLHNRCLNKFSINKQVADILYYVYSSYLVFIFTINTLVIPTYMAQNKILNNILYKEGN